MVTISQIHNLYILNKRTTRKKNEGKKTDVKLRKLLFCAQLPNIPKLDQL